MMIKSFFVLLALIAFAGCASHDSLNYRPVSVYTSGRMNVESYKEPAPRNAFQAREQIVAVIRSTDSKERTVLVEFLNADTGNVVSKQVVTCHSGMVRCTGPTTTFPAGSYVVKVSADGVLLDAANFAVYGY